MSSSSSSAVLSVPGHNPIEVTASEYQRTVRGTKYASNKERNIANSYKKVTKMSWGFIPASRKKKDSDSVCSKQSSSGFSSCQQSVANVTVNSGTTLKASNLHGEHVEQKLESLYSNYTAEHFEEPNENCSGIKQQKSKRTSNSKASNKHNKPHVPWKSLKRFVDKVTQHKHHSTSLTPQSSSDSGNRIQRRHAKSHDGAEAFSTAKLDNDYPMRKRFHSDGVASSSQQDSFDVMSAMDSQHAIDQLIQARLDGIDTLSLGPVSGAMSNDASSQSKDDITSNDNNEKDIFSFGPLHTSFTNLPSPRPPADIIEEMLWTSAGNDHAEILFEGFYPGCNDRWGVHIATPSSPLQRTCSKPSKDGLNPFRWKVNRIDSDASTATTATDNDGSTSLPINELWDSLWGVVSTPPPIPTHMQTISASNTGSTIGNDDPLDDGHQEFVDMCNVPIDLDDDAFMIDSPQHVKSIHDVIMVPLQAGRFRCAISIFEKLERGLEGNEKCIHMVASTSHNIGMVQLCQGKYQEALESFQKAVELRKQHLPEDHPDIAVSLQREGMAHFALGSMVEALESFEAALALCVFMDNARAKLLNSIGVVQYQLNDYSSALKSFTSALEIQRPWLEGLVRRESIVTIASTILSNIGKVHLRKGDFDLAYRVFEEACLMQTSIFRLDHDNVLSSMDNMGRAQSQKGNHAEALKIFTSLLRSQRQRFGPDSNACIETLGMMGFSHFKLLDYEEAEKCMKEVVEWQKSKGGMDASHPLVKITDERLEQIKRCLQGREPVWV